MGLLKDFKAFAIKGNVVDLAVAVILGIAFKEIVNSLVNDIVMPVIGVLIGGKPFQDLALVLQEATSEETAAVLMSYGVFLQKILDFILIAFFVFLFVRGIDRLKKKAEEAASEPPAPSNEEVLLAEIRDLLKAQPSANH